MHDGDPGRPALPRRGLLRALALGPAALAGCAALGAGREPGIAAPDPGDARGGGPAPAPQAAADAAVAAVRAVRLAEGAEPAFVFRAAPARPGDPR